MALGTDTQPQGASSSSNPVSAYMGAASSNAFSGGGQPSGAVPAAGGQGLGTPQPNRNNIMALLGSIYGPQQQAQQQQQQGLLNQLALQNAGYTTDRGALQTNYGLDQRGLGLDRQQLGIDRGAAARALANTIEQERLARAMTGNQKKTLGLGYEKDTRGERSDATARGALTTPGTRTNLKDMYGNFLLGNERLDLGLESDLLGIREQRNQARDRQKALDLESKRLGLNSDQLSSQLDQALDQLGLGNLMSTNDIFSALSSGNAQQAGLARQIMEDLINFGGNPAWLTQQQSRSYSAPREHQGAYRSQ